MTQAWPSWRAAAETEIRALVHHYNALGDAGRFDDFLDLFHEDATYEVTGEAEPYVGRSGLRELLESAKEDLLGWAAGRPIHMRHFTSTHLVELTGPTEATGRCYYQCVMPHGLDHWGRYVDTYRQGGDGRWRFQSRREARDGMVEDGWCWALWGPAGSRRQGEPT